MRIIEIAYSFGLVIMFHFNHFRNLANDENRFFLHWSYLYATKFIFFLFIQTIVIYLIYRIIKRVKPILAKPGFLFLSWYLLVYSIMGIYVPPIDPEKARESLSFFWYLPFLLPFIILGIYSHLKLDPLYNITKLMVCIWAAIGLSLCAGLFFYPNRGHMVSEIQEVNNIPQEANQPPVFIFLLDNWSGPRIYELYKEQLPNTSSLIGQSNYYNYAFSLGDSTEEALPAFIFQNPYGFTLNKKEGVYIDNNTNTNSTEMDSMFTIFKREGYYTAIIGAYHPFKLMLNDKDMDFISSYPEYESNSISTVFFMINRSLQYASGPVIRWLAYPVNRLLVTYNKYSRDKKMLNDVYYASSHWKGKVFAFFHIEVPHSPFIYKEDGSVFVYKEGLFNSRYDDLALENYINVLKYTDSIVGNIISRLKSNNMFDKSLIIFTSDHNWKWDKKYRAQGKKMWDCVPLIIKYPYQKKGTIITKRVELPVIKPIFQKIISSDK